MNLKQLLLNWEALIILLLLLVVNSAFFSEDLIGMAIAGSGVLLLAIVYRMISRGRQIEVNWITIVCWFIALSYIGTLWTTVSIEGSLLKAIEWFTYGILLLFIKQDYHQNAHKMMRLFAIIFILLQTISMFKMEDIPLDAAITASGVRLSGTLGYANATAAIAAMLLLYVLYAHLEEQPWPYIDALIMGMLAFILFMTESRGALLVLAVSWLIGLMVMKKQMAYFTLFISHLIVGFLAYCIVLIMQGAMVSIVIALVFSIGMALLIEKIHSKWQWQLPKWWIPSVIIGFATIGFIIVQLNILPASIQNRLTLATLQARFVYMQDAWQALKEFWLFGAGGESWKFVVYQYQSTGYVSNDIHMFLEQQWLETGIIGFAIIVIALIIGLLRVYQSKRALIPVILMLLLHSCIDFTLSYGVSLMLVFLLFLEGLKRDAYYKLQTKINVIPIACIAIFTLATSIIWQQGENSFKQFAKTNDAKYLEHALQKNPYATRYYEAQAMYAKQPVESYENILKNEPRHAKYWFYAGQSYYQLGEHEKAMHYFEQSLTYDRFDWNKYKLAQEALLGIGSAEALALNEKFSKQKKAMEQLAKTSKLKNQDRENILKSNN